MITALPLHVRRLLQHSGPHIHFFKRCYEVRAYICIWASRQSSNYLANVHQRGQLYTCRPVLTLAPPSSTAAPG
jgi:hypothetical protein